MNYILCKRGYIGGTPGDYSPTEKAAPFVEENYYHRGTGGSVRYNAYWTTRSYDEFILEDLNDISEEEISWAVAKVAERISAQRISKLQSSNLQESNIINIDNSTSSFDSTNNNQTHNNERGKLVFGSIIALCIVAIVGHKIKKFYNKKKHII